jgi:hypothetical protein
VLRNTSASGTIDASSFAPIVDFTTNPNPNSLAIGDLDGDGIPEIAIGYNSTNTFSILQINSPPATTTTAVTSSLNPSTFGQGVTFTATVTTGTGTPTGTVAFFDGATNIGTGTLSGNTATFTTTSLATGSHNITANYAGNANYAASTSPVLTQTVNAAPPATTTTSVTSSLNPSTFGQGVTFTATVTTGTGTPTGTVTFFDGATNIGSGTLSGNTATITTTSLATGSHSITANYAGNANYAASTSPVLTQTVNAAPPATTTTTVTSSLNPSTAGQSVTFTATVATGTGTPTGTVTFFDGATNIGTGTLSGNTATFTTTSLATGSHNITANYAGNANYAASTSPVLTQTVNAAPLATTTTTITSSNNPSTFGQSVTFTATVTTGTGTPTGTVTFFDGATNIGTGTLSGNTATFTTTSLATGSHNITANYAGNANYAASTSPVLTQTVNAAPPATTVTTITSSLNPSIFGQGVTISVVVKKANGTTVTSGIVTFYDGTAFLGTGDLSGFDSIHYFTTAYAIGSHNITATFGGNSSYAASTSSILIQVVNAPPPASTTTTITSSLNPSTFGQSVTFTATINTASGTPTGTVTFFDGATNIGTGTLSGNTATFSTTILATGSHNITANYNGNTTHAASKSSVLIQVVNAAPPSTTTTTITSSINPSTFGQSVTFTATVTTGTGTPTGTVTFFDGVTNIGIGTLTGNTATFTTSALTTGSHNITANYGGNASYAASTSSVLTQVVNAAPPSTTTTTITSSNNPSTTGQSVTFTATVTTATGTPTGTVTFFDGATNIGTGTLSGNKATFTTSALTTGSHNITATYNGNATHATSTSSVLVQVVNAAGSVKRLHIYPNPVTAGFIKQQI